jgi:hypothetical protein
MAHTFHVAFLSHTSSKRKYCFSVNDVETRSKWGNVLARLIAATRTAKSQAASRIRQAAEGVALQVLRDAVIPPEEKMSKSAISKIARSRSVSVAYAHQAGRNERDLGELQASKPAVEGDGVGGLMDIQTGKELVLLCRQNSLLPGLLESLQAGIGSGNGGGAQYSHERMECYGSQEMKEKGFTRTENVKARVPGGMV